MIITYLLLLAMIAIFVAGIVTFFRIRDIVPLMGWLDTNEMGIVERDIRKLKEVIIICDRIEEPLSLLRDAVLDNFKDGVSYRFFLSADQYHKSVQEFQPFFNNL